MKRCHTTLRDGRGNPRDGDSLFKACQKDLKRSQTCPAIPEAPAELGGRDRANTKFAIQKMDSRADGKQVIYIEDT